MNSWWTTEQHDHLAVGINYRSEQLPGASSTIHTQHAQDLQESQTPDSRGGKNIALRAGCEHWYWSDQHHHVWEKKRTQGYIQDSQKLYVTSAWMNNTLLCPMTISFLAAEPLTLLCSRALTFTFRFLRLQVQIHPVSRTASKQRTCWELHQDVIKPSSTANRRQTQHCACVMSFWESQMR